MEIVKIWRNTFIELFLETYSFFYSSETPEKLCIVSDTPRFPFGRDRIFLSSSKQDKRIETHLDCLHGRIDMAGSYSRAAEYVTAQQKIIFRFSVLHCDQRIFRSFPPLSATCRHGGACFLSRDDFRHVMG